MNGIGELLAIIYFVGCIGIAIYLITLASRFVSAHERVADALDKIARKQQDDSKP